MKYATIIGIGLAVGGILGITSSLTQETSSLTEQSDLADVRVLQIAATTEVKADASDDLGDLDLEELEKACDGLLDTVFPADCPTQIHEQLAVLKGIASQIKEQIVPMKVIASKLSDGTATAQDRLEFKRLRTGEFDKLRREYIREKLTFNAIIAPLLPAKKERKPRKEAYRRADRDLGVTWEAYQILHNGMTRYDAYLTIGTWGKELSSAGAVKTYAWRDGYRSIGATFHRDRLISKSQFGL